MANGNGDLYYAREKIDLAIHAMATSAEPIQQRLLNAWMMEGHHALPMGPDQAGRPMSDELVARLLDFNKRMSCQPAKGNEGTYAATILALSDDDASDAAGELLDIGYSIRIELQA